MEEKERYEVLGNSLMVADNETEGICNLFSFYECVNLLNQQDKRINELKQENQQLKEQLKNEEQSHDLCIKSFEEETDKLRKQIKFESDARERFKQENQLLKEQLKEELQK